MKGKCWNNVILFGGLAMAILAAASFWIWPPLPSGRVVETVKGTGNKVRYEVQIRNPQWGEVTLCGGQMNWCGVHACYAAELEMPQTVSARGNLRFWIEMTPRSESVGETEYTVFVEGKTIKGLIPLKIKLPATSCPQNAAPQEPAPQTQPPQEPASQEQPTQDEPTQDE